MTDYRFVGIADVLSFSKDDFARHQIDDQEDVEFSAANDWTATLSDGAAELLKRHGFSLMSVEDYEAFLEKERAKAAKEAVEREEGATVNPPVPADLFPDGQPPKVIPPRPAATSGRDELASYAWTHYQIPVDTEDHKMTKAEINKALDEVGAVFEEETGDQPPNEGVATNATSTTRTT